VDEFDLPETDVYIMGHHGSSTSSSEKFLEEIKPKYSLFSSEDPKGSKYGFPSLAALKRVNEYSHGEIYGTEKNGDINFLIDENGQIDFENSNLIKTTQG
jgi:competence protein ComEC